MPVVSCGLQLFNGSFEWRCDKRSSIAYAFPDVQKHKRWFIELILLVFYSYFTLITQILAHVASIQLNLLIMSSLSSSSSSALSSTFIVCGNQTAILHTPRKYRVRPIVVIKLVPLTLYIYKSSSFTCRRTSSSSPRWWRKNRVRKGYRKLSYI